ncbi:uncharacterized protein F4817DRAFT_256332 [Daldinia loculata]|uniref:uncharacterized protein n=1 Tax=Daldinia loculata TaxID=103429 RepID=UPI0020C2AA46|nr:uncharacterized protein F4817DRAFT_256332 [Daldinia loculata]KAI1643354.1 hypothetical protein F4817DRAFT_256332 [Daldinia loculata]
MVKVDKISVQTCMMISMSCKPLVFVVGTKSLPLLLMSTLGKTSGVKMRALFEASMFEKDVEFHSQSVLRFRNHIQEISAGEGVSETEALLQRDIAKTRGSKIRIPLELIHPFSSWDSLRWTSFA